MRRAGAARLGVIRPEQVDQVVYVQRQELVERDAVLGGKTLGEQIRSGKPERIADAPRRLALRAPADAAGESSTEAAGSSDRSACQSHQSTVDPVSRVCMEFARLRRPPAPSVVVAAAGGRSDPTLRSRMPPDDPDDPADLDAVRLKLLYALVQAGVTGDETFGDLLDAIDEYTALCVAAALGEAPELPW